MRILFLHGLESGPHGEKYHALVRAFGHERVIAPDCQGLTTVGARLVKVMETLDTAGDPVLVVGSSFGAAVAVALYGMSPDLVSGMVLCAPAIYRMVGIPEFDPARVRVLHGWLDDVIAPLDVCRFCQDQCLDLQVVTDDHRLSESSDVMVALVQDLIAL